jgi:hypothetical protein
MMPSDKDLLGKADALLRRHSGVGSDTGVFPVLTDLIDDTAKAEATEEKVPEVFDPTKAESTEEIVREVFARVTAEVEARLAVDLEKRLAEQLVPHIHAAVAGTIADLRQELMNAIGDAVAAALERRSVK